MGEAINLVNNFKVEKVIFNCGELNTLEKDLIKVLKEKNVKESSNNNTIGILICKRENKFVIEYCSDNRIAIREYELV